MTDLFKQLQEAKEQQDQVLQQVIPPPKEEKTLSKQDARKVAQKSAQLSKEVRNPLSEELVKYLSQDAVQELSFRLRKTPQSKLDTTIPLEWREKFDNLAFKLKVGKYELLKYIVGVFLGEVEQPKP